MVKIGNGKLVVFVFWFLFSSSIPVFMYTFQKFKDKEFWRGILWTFLSIFLLMLIIKTSYVPTGANSVWNYTIFS